MLEKLIRDLAIGFVVPPVLTGLWLIFVRFNNRRAERTERAKRIEPHPWWNLIHGYVVVLFLTALDLLRK